MVNLRAKYETNKDAESEGVWVDSEGYSVKLARFNCPENIKLIKRQQKPFKNMTIADDIAKRHAIESMAKIVIKDWSGITDDNGKEIKFSEDSAIELLTDCEDLHIEWLNLSTNAELYNKQALKDAEKNLLKRSSGSSTGGKKQSG